MIDANAILSTMTVSERRLKHTLGVAEAAKALAMTHFPDLDIKTVELAALMHDYTKEYPLERHLELCSLFGIEITEDDIENYKLLHAKTGAIIAKDSFRLPDDACSAIYWHTTGREAMTPFEIVIYLADYIEDFREDPGCVALREYYKKRMAKEKDKSIALTKTLIRAFDTTIKHLMSNGRTINEDTIKARNYYIKQLSKTV